MLCVSPYPHYRKDRPTNPCLYWINSYNGDKFSLATASGAALSSTSFALQNSDMLRVAEWSCVWMNAVFLHAGAPASWKLPLPASR